MKNYEYKNCFVDFSSEDLRFSKRKTNLIYDFSCGLITYQKNYHKIIRKRNCMYLSCHQTSRAISQYRVQISRSESEVCSIDDAAHVIRTSAWRSRLRYYTFHAGSYTLTPTWGFCRSSSISRVRKLVRAKDGANDSARKAPSASAWNSPTFRILSLQVRLFRPLREHRSYRPKEWHSVVCI